MVSKRLLAAPQFHPSCHEKPRSLHLDSVNRQLVRRACNFKVADVMIQIQKVQNYTMQQKLKAYSGVVWVAL